MGRVAETNFAHIAVELFYLRETAKAAGQPFLAYLIGMAAIEAEKLGTRPEAEEPEEKAEAPQLLSA